MPVSPHHYDERCHEASLEKEEFFHKSEINGVGDTFTTVHDIMTMIKRLEPRFGQACLKLKLTSKLNV